MNETIKSIIFAIFGFVIVVFGIITSASWEVIGFGGVITVFAVGCQIYDIIKLKKQNKIEK